MTGSFHRLIRTALLLAVYFSGLALQPQQPSRISLKMEAKSLVKGKAMIINAEIFYQYDQGRMLTHYLKPFDYIMITNNKGEASVYYPGKNEVYAKQSFDFDTEKGMLYYFLSNKISDLGLRDMGFRVIGTRFEDGLSITNWMPPGEMLRSFSKVEMVHEDYKPIYAAYFNPKGKVLKKIYYYDYLNLPGFVLPSKVVQVDFLQGGDSLISKITYSDIRTGNQATSEYFNFRIPVNAKPGK